MTTTLKSIMALLMLAVLQPAWAGDPQVDKLISARDVLNEVMSIPETSIPPSLMGNSHGIAVVPNVIKVGFVIGGRGGKGVVAVRNPKTGEWGNPVFITLAGGSVGWQVGAQSTDIVLVFKNREGVLGMVDSKFTLGADAAVAAGPVGRETAMATDGRLKAEIYSYSRSRGLFAGVSLDGSVLEVDSYANDSYYGKPGIMAKDILDRQAGVPTPAEAEQFRQTLIKYTSDR